MKINREDMLELIRRLTPARCNLVRIAGAYMDGKHLAASVCTQRL